MVAFAKEDFDTRIQTRNWLDSRIDNITELVDRQSPTNYVEGARYIPASVTRFPGYINFDLTPYWREIVDCFDPDCPVREVIVLKGVQIAYTTALESIVFYYVGHVRTAPIIYATADLGLSSVRMENNFLPMFQHSGMNDLFVSHDVGNTRKRGIKKSSLQWRGGGYMLPFGAQNANKARQQSVPNVFMDEIDGWPEKTKDGSDLVGLFSDRGSSFWPVRKIFIGSTPNLAESSRITREHARGDQRVYKCRCLKCGFPQEIRFSGHNAETGEVYGFRWDYHGNGSLDIDSVRYHCQECGHPHVEYDKPKFFSSDNAYWEPTAVESEPNVRSYHVPAFLSPAGMQPWYKSVSMWLKAWDVKHNRVKDVGALQRFYNNVLGKGFETQGSKITLQHASAHRRMWYSKGAIVNARVSEYCDSKILFLTCTVDVHKSNLAIAIWGWTENMTCWLIDYKREWDNSEAGLESPESCAWKALTEIIDSGRWKADGGREYWLAATLIDTGWNAAVVADYCAQFNGVFPIVGRANTARGSRLEEFGEYKTKIGTTGYIIKVDHYKDRIAPVLRREWEPAAGKQQPYTFNGPVDMTDKEIKELTAEKRKEKLWDDGSVTYSWHRPQGVDNELWDLMVYGHASVEIIAWMICVKHYKMETVDWKQFWEFVGQGMFFEEKGV